MTIFGRFAALGISGAIVAAIHLASPAPCQIVVIDSAGNEFVAGSGDDVRAAWRFASVPEGWREITFRNCH